MSSGPHAHVPVKLHPDAVKRLRIDLTNHADDPEMGMCITCCRVRCPEYVRALSALIAAGEAVDFF